jgi:hypothetical protein
VQFEIENPFVEEHLETVKSGSAVLGIDSNDYPDTAQMGVEVIPDTAQKDEVEILETVVLVILEMIAVVIDMIVVIVNLDRMVVNFDRMDVEVIPDIARMDGVENLEKQWNEEVNHEMKWMDEEVSLGTEKALE